MPPSGTDRIRVQAISARMAVKPERAQSGTMRRPMIEGAPESAGTGAPCDSTGSGVSAAPDPSAPPDASATLGAPARCGAARGGAVGRRHVRAAGAAPREKRALPPPDRGDEEEAREDAPPDRARRVERVEPAHRRIEARTPPR